MEVPGPRSVRLHDRDVAYEVRGDPTVGTPLLLVHGIGSTGDAWAPVVDRLTAAGLCTIAVDLPGHGRSSKKAGDYSLGALASTLRDLLTHLEVSRCILVGHSLGGGIALQFSYQYPERLAALALVSSGGLGKETSAVLRWTALPGSGLVIAAAFNPLTLAVLSGLGRVFSAAGRRIPAAFAPSTIDRLREIADPDHRNAFLSILRAVVDQSGQKVSALARLPLLANTPTLIVWGQNDHILPVSHGMRAHAMLPRSTFIVFADAGHEPHVDDPDAMAELLIELAEESDRLSSRRVSS
jgi:pimeloyl-ACP methyl ester carboxylesterase